MGRKIEAKYCDRAVLAKGNECPCYQQKKLRERCKLPQHRSGAPVSVAFLSANAKYYDATDNNPCRR